MKTKATVAEFKTFLSPQKLIIVTIQADSACPYHCCFHDNHSAHHIHVHIQGMLQKVSIMYIVGILVIIWFFVHVIDRIWNVLLDEIFLLFTKKLWKFYLEWESTKMLSNKIFILCTTCVYTSVKQLTKYFITCIYIYTHQWLIAQNTSLIRFITVYLVFTSI